jgi:hypothetical protein
VEERGSAIMIVAITCLLIGLVLGQGFKALVLMPATALLLVLVAAGGLVVGDSLGGAVILALGAGVALQIGYCVGLVVRHLLTSSAATQSVRSAHARGESKG